MKVVALLAILLTCDALTLESLLLEEWSAFKTTFNKSYTDLRDEVFRREIFLENRHKIALHNIEFGLAKKTFTQVINGFGDMLNHEFINLINGFNRTARINPEAIMKREKLKNIRSSSFVRPVNVIVPEHMDWREYGAVSPVKYQGVCASCWAFSAAGAIEGHNFRKTGVLRELSAQNLLDCTTPYGNSGCEGGLMDAAYEYVRDNFGINSEPVYGYEARSSQCRFRDEDRAADDTGFVLIPEGDEDAVKVALATLGPVSAAMDAGQDSFQFYSDGVYYEPNCESLSEKLNHGVLIVGYGTERDGRDYWIIKNSYGTAWGQAGYMKLARNANNHCGIASSVTYPIV